MTGTVFINKQSFHDVRTVYFAWLVEELRSKLRQSETLRAKVLWAHDEAAMDMLMADELDEAEFKQFAHAMQEISDALAKEVSRAGMSKFLEMLLMEIEKDARYS